MRFSELPLADLQEISRRGGVASGEARREKRRRIEAEKVESAALEELRADLRASHRREAALLAAAARGLRAGL